MTPTVPVPAAPNPAQPPKKVLSNLFSAKAPVKKEVKAEQKKQEGDKKKGLAMLYFGLAAALLVLYGVLFLYPHLNSYLKAGESLDQMIREAAGYRGTVLPDLEIRRLENKVAYESEFNKEESIVAQIFPGDVERVEITKRLESFASLINSKTPPFEMNRLNFDEPVKEKEVAILPISTSFSTSRANLDRFMKLIDLSGRFDSEYHVRLMDIQKLSIRFLGVDARTGLDKGVTVNVKLNAYSRPERQNPKKP